MSSNDISTGGLAAPEATDSISALFAGFVVQQTNMALMLLGRVPHPETGEQVRDLDAAKLFIDQLAMLEAKTKGNLDRREDQLLKQSLTTLRMAFVEAVEESAAAKPKSAQPQAGSPSPDPQPQGSAGGSPEPASEEGPHKKFSKKY